MANVQRGVKIHFRVWVQWPDDGDDNAVTEQILFETLSAI